MLEFFGVGFDAESEDIGLDGFEAVEAPIVVGDLVAELGFDDALGLSSARKSA
jgi:hypothetical protein